MVSDDNKDGGEGKEEIKGRIVELEEEEQGKKEEKNKE